MKNNVIFDWNNNENAQIKMAKSFINYLEDLVLQDSERKPIGWASEG